MNQTLPSLRRGLDIFPSPVAEKPGLLIRDPYRYAEDIVIIPPLLVGALNYFDGKSTLLDAQAHLSKQVGQLVSAEVIQSMLDALKYGGFLETEEFLELRQKREADFAKSPTRLSANSGSGYSEEPVELTRTLHEYLSDFQAPASDPIIGLASPDVSPWLAPDCYAAAYGRLSGIGKQNALNKTIVVLGTGRYMQPQRFGMTRKPYVTPLGEIEPDCELIDWLAARAGGSIIMEDYCHSFEYSIEFQCVFLKHMLGPDFKFLPILCGPFSEALQTGAPPENNDDVLRFIDALGEMADQYASKLFWLLGFDLSHFGVRWGDPVATRANEGEMLKIGEEDRQRLEHICAGRVDDFFEMVKPEQDRLKWSGFAPIYTFLRSVEKARGNLLRYDQFNIDEESVVSIAAIEFRSV